MSVEHKAEQQPERPQPKTKSDHLLVKTLNDHYIDDDDRNIILSLISGTLPKPGLSIGKYKKPNVNCANSSGKTALHIACIKNDAELVESLLENGANPLQKDDSGKTALDYAIEKSGTTIFRHLIENVIIKGNSINDQDASGQTLLHKACAQGKTNVAIVLLQNSANHAITDNSGQTALHKACAQGITDLAIELLKIGALPTKDNSGQTPLDILIEKRYLSENEELFRLLIGDPLIKGAINDQDASGQTLLHKACARGYTVLTRILLENGAATDIVDNEGQTPLHKACNVATVTELLRHGANPDLRDNLGQTPLHKASEACQERIVIELLQNGAATDIVDNEGQTALHKACNKHKKETITALLDHGADCTIHDVNGDTPLHFAAARNNTESCQLLIKHGATDCLNNAGNSPSKLAEGYRSDLPQIIVNGCTEYHSRMKELLVKFATTSGNDSVIDLFANPHLLSLITDGLDSSPDYHLVNRSPAQREAESATLSGLNHIQTTKQIASLKTGQQALQQDVHQLMLMMSQMMGQSSPQSRPSHKVTESKSNEAVLTQRQLV